MVFRLDASKAQNTIAAVSASFGARRQHDPGLDPALKLFAQSRMAGLSNHHRIRCPDRFPLAFREACEGEELVARFLQARFALISGFVPA
jgi:hypothetical protein